jgi:DNA-binding CsgD family transcriptional regulator
MQKTDKTLWRAFAIIGTLIMLVAFVISVMQYFTYKQHDALFLVRYDSLCINTQLLAAFIYLIFNPLNFRVYAISFYIFGVGNLLDNGNILGMVFLITASVFFFITGFFYKKRTLKIVLLLIPIALALAFQCTQSSLINFAISLMHIVAAAFLFSMLAALMYPEIKKLRSLREVVFIENPQVTQQDVDWLNKVLNGTRYITIALEADVSESSVKAQMLKLYKLLGANSKSEFCAMYHNSKFELKLNADTNQS